jgi:carboxyl-terminal processing protease
LTWARLVTPAGYYLQSHGVVPTLCTGTLSDDDRSLDAALHAVGETGPGGVSASQPRATLSDAAWKALRQACPAKTESPPLDLKIAERVLADPVRYGEAVSAIRPATTQPPHAGEPPVPALTARRGSLSSATDTP